MTSYYFTPSLFPHLIFCSVFKRQSLGTKTYLPLQTSYLVSMSIENTINSLRKDTVVIFLSCVADYEINYDEIEYDTDLDSEEIRTKLFYYILENNDVARSIFKIVGLVLIMTYMSNTDYFALRGITNQDIMLNDFIESVLQEPEVQEYLNVHYYVFINRK